MADPFIGEIRMMAFTYPPKGWAQCNGQLMPINQNQALYSLIGPVWGGDGRTTFALPDLRGRAPIHAGNGHFLSERAGQEAHTLTLSAMPLHTHVANASATDGNTNLPGGNLPAAAANVYGPAGSLTTVEPATVSTAGGTQPHTNMMPSLPLLFCLALQGIFPSPN